MDNMQIASMKAELQGELALLKKRCTTIENLLRNLDDYQMPVTVASVAASTPHIRKGNIATAKPVEGPLTVVQRASNALITIPEPFTLVQLKGRVGQDGLGEIGRGNWGIIVQKLKKRAMIECVEGQEGKPGALYKRIASGESAETSTAGEGA